MVIRDLDIVCIFPIPPEANPPLIVDPNAMLTFPISFQRLQPVTRRHSQIAQFRSGIDDSELLSCRILNIQREPPRDLSPIQVLSLLVFERSDHLVSGYHVEILLSSDSNAGNYPP